MFKIISTELKKTVSKPGIYILSAVLALILVLAVFIYDPVVIENKKIELYTITYVDKYNEFLGDSSKGIKTEYQEKINNSIYAINCYTINDGSKDYNHKTYIEKLIEKCNENFNAYMDCVNVTVNSSYINTTRQNLENSFIELNNVIENAFLNSEYGAYPIVTSESNYQNYKDSYKLVLAWVKTTVSKENLKAHIREYQTKYENDFFNTINNFKYPALSSEFVKTYTITSESSKLSILNQRLDAILKIMSENNDKAINNASFNTAESQLMDDLANNYVETVNTYTNLIKYELLSNAFKDLSTNEQLNAIYLSDYSSFECNSLLVRYNYLFENDKSEYDFAHPLTIGVTSTNQTNAYDYAYFVLRVFSFVLIIYSIMAACHTIAGEIKEGSMRYLAIRPISRTSMFFGKWIAIVIMSIILMIFSLIISLCVGIGVYGHSNLTILTIFNGTTPLIVKPISMLLIYLASMLLELIIYSMIAMLFSSLFKSDLMSVTVLLVLYLLNTLMPIFIQGTNSWLAFYPFSHISLYSLFGSSIYATKANFFNVVFGAKVYAGTSLTLTLSVIILMFVIFSFFATRIFKHKEL